MSAGASFVRKIVCFWSARLVGVPSVLHVHGGEFVAFYSRAPRSVQALIRATLSRAVCVLALGDQWARKLSTIAPAADVRSMPNATHAAMPVCQVTGGSVHIVFLGQVSRLKGAFVLLEAWHRMKSGSIRPVHLTVAGNGELDRARAIVDRHGIDSSVTIHEWLSADAVRELLSSAHVLVLPSFYEGQPMAILEAMAHGLCIVASDVGGIPDLVRNDESGVLVAPDDVDQLTKALDDVVLDDDLRCRLGTAAFKRFEQEFDMEVVWRRLDALYAATVRRPPS